MIRNYPYRGCIYPFNKPANDFVVNNNKSFLTKSDLFNLKKKVIRSNKCSFNKLIIRRLSMCNKHSFLSDKQGKIYNGSGIIESHTLIAKINKVDEDKCNKYEYNPANNSCDCGIKGLVIDNQAFEVDGRLVEQYINKYFPDQKSFDTYSNINTPVTTLIKLSKDDDYRVRRAVAYNSNTPVTILAELGKDSCSYTREAVAFNSNTPIAALTKLSKDSYSHVRSAVACNSNTPKAVLVELSKDSDSDVHRAVAKNRSDRQ